jgi:hypothetical protein
MSREFTDCPMVTNRDSLVEWTGSETVAASGSPKTVVASSKETPCFVRLAAAFLGSHWNLTP